MITLFLNRTVIDLIRAIKGFQGSYTSDYRILSKPKSNKISSKTRRNSCRFCILYNLLVIFFVVSLGKIVYAQDFAYDINNTVAQSRDIIPKAPTAASLGEYVSQPVGYYTGIPKISIPLWNVQLKDFSLPISLSYHAGGIRVEEPASNVGLGWSLNAGGVITRAVKDIPDDQTTDHCFNQWHIVEGQDCPTVDEYSYCGYGLLYALDASPNDHFNGIDSYDIDLSNYNGEEGEASYSLNLLRQFYGVTQDQPGSFQDLYLLPVVDKEPDVYYFNFGNYTGKFVFDVSGNSPEVRIVPYQDLEIEYSTDAQDRIDEFRVTDENGVLYIFNAVEVTESHARLNFADNISNDGAIDTPLEVKSYEPGATVKEFTSSWYLSKIETPLGEYLDFTYADEEYRLDNRGPQNTSLGNSGPTPAYTLDYDPNIIDKNEAEHSNFYAYFNALKTNYSIIHGKRISAIENDEIKITFLSEHVREDLVYDNDNKTPYAIDEVIIYNKIGGLERVKKFELNYDYFTSNVNENINPGGTFVKVVQNGEENEIINLLDIRIEDSVKYYKRLRLRSVEEYGSNDVVSKPPYQFEYKDKDFTGNSGHSLPHRLSLQQDYWGYYNAASGNNTLIPKLWVYPTHYQTKDSRQFSLYPKSNYTGDEYIFKGSERRPNPNTVDIGLLTKIKYPTGGFTIFEYGSHIFNHYGEDEIGGGVRINRIIKHAGPGENVDEANDIIIDYDYTELNSANASSGEIISLPIFAKRDKNIYGINYANDNSEIAYNLWTTRYSLPQGPLYQTSGSYVGYRTVTEYKSGNGKTVRKYSMPATWHIENDIPIDESGGLCDPSIDGHCDGFYKATKPVNIFVSRDGTDLSVDDYDFSQFPARINTFPFPENPNYDWQRGHLLWEGIFNENGGKVKETIFNYKNYFPNGNSEPIKIYGYKLSHHYPLLENGTDPNTYAFRAAKYEWLANVVKVLDTKTEKIYDQNDQTKSYSTEISFDYENNTYPGITKMQKSGSDNKNIIIENEYSTDFSGSEFGSDLLRNKHIHNQILRVRKSVEGNSTTKIETNFESINGKIVPTSYNLYPNGVTKSVKEVNNYDSYGNLTESFAVLEEDANGNMLQTDMYTSYIWGYNNSRLIVKAINTTNTVLKSAVIDALSSVGYNGGLGDIDQLLNDVSGLDTEQKRSVWIDFNNSLSNHTDMNEARITTYTYNPLKGINSQTDPNGKITYYEYDELNRLKLIKDFERNIITKNSYQYKVE